MPNKQIAQKVIDFEYSRIRSINEQKKKTNYEYGRFSNRFSCWNLSQLINFLKLNERQFNLLWVGYGHHCLTEAFLFCLIQICKYAQEESNMLFIHAKYCLYQLAEKYLTLKQQKQLVQNLCYVQYAKSIVAFINKSHDLQDMILKIFKGHVDDNKQYILPIQQLKSFASNFSFLEFELMNDFTAKMTYHELKYYIILQKECVFIADLNKTSEPMSDRKSGSLQTSQVYLYKGQISPPSDNNNNIGVQNSNEQASTPKFLRNGNSHFKISTNDKLNKHFYQSKNANNNFSKIENQVSKFDDQLISIQKKNEQNLSNLTKIKEQQMESQQYSEKKMNKPYFKIQKTPISSLRNTIDIHITNLQNFGHRNKKHKNKSFGFNPRLVQRQAASKKNITVVPIPQIIKSKSWQNHRAISPQSTKQTTQLNYFKAPHMGYLSGYLTPHPQQIPIPIYSHSFRNSITSRHRVSFTYTSP